MTYAVCYTSLKGETAGTVKTETYETFADATFTASMMRESGHHDAKAAKVEPATVERKAVKLTYMIRSGRKGRIVIDTLDGRDGMKGRSDRLAEALCGRWSHRERGYVLSARAADHFRTLYDAGIDACYRIFRDAPVKFDGFGFSDLTRAQALKLAKDAMQS